MAHRWFNLSAFCIIQTFSVLFKRGNDKSDTALNNTLETISELTMTENAQNGAGGASNGDQQAAIAEYAKQRQNLKALLAKRKQHDRQLVGCIRLPQN